MKNKYKLKFKLNLPNVPVNPSSLSVILGSKSINVVQFCSKYNKIIEIKNETQVNSLCIYIYSNNQYIIKYKSPTVTSVLYEILNPFKFIKNAYWKNYVTDKEIYIIFTRKYKDRYFLSYKTVKKSIKSTLLGMRVLSEF